MHLRSEQATFVIDAIQEPSSSGEDDVAVTGQRLGEANGWRLYFTVMETLLPSFFTTELWALVE